VRAPGLHALCRTCAVDPSARVSGGGVSVEAGPQSVQLFASVPLTDEPWQPLPEGTVVAARGGQLADAAA
jgi:hypothetical protein